MNKKILVIIWTVIVLVITTTVGSLSVWADKPTIVEYSERWEGSLEEYFWWAPVSNPKGCEFPVQVVEEKRTRITIHSSPNGNSWLQAHIHGKLTATGNGQTLKDSYAQLWRCDDPENCKTEFDDHTLHGKNFVTVDRGEGTVFTIAGTAVIKDGELVSGAGQVQTLKEFFDCYQDAGKCNFQKAQLPLVCTDLDERECRFYALFWERWSEAYCSVLRD
jgi:hypothetical protein